jgi:nitric oxide synthase oxygenase domain/subunit/hemoglobin-like flavoprotein
MDCNPSSTATARGGLTDQAERSNGSSSAATTRGGLTDQPEPPNESSSAATTRGGLTDQPEPPNESSSPVNGKLPATPSPVSPQPQQAKKPEVTSAIQSQAEKQSGAKSSLQPQTADQTEATINGSQGQAEQPSVLRKVNTQSSDPSSNGKKDIPSFALLPNDTDEDFQTQVKDAIQELRIYDAPLTDSDKVMVMQGWNKVLAFKTAFSEALWIHWRLLVASDVSNTPMGMVERNEDPLAVCMMERIPETEELIMGLVDGALRSLCPKAQTVQREAYRPVQDDAHIQRLRGEELTLECECVQDYLKLFSRCGVLPGYWVHFCSAFTWALKTHTPYAKDDDHEEFDCGVDSAYARGIAQTVAKPAVMAYKELKSIAEQDLYRVGVKRVWDRLSKDDRILFGQEFYRTLLISHPNLLDYFSRTDMDSLAIHFIASIDLLVHSVAQLGKSTGPFRHVLNHLGAIHKKMGVPTYSYPLVGGHLLACLGPSFSLEEKESKTTKTPFTAKELHSAYLTLYVEVMSLVYYPMLQEEKMIARARELYGQLQQELQWTDAQLSHRLLQVEQEIAATDTYTHTSEELEMAARLAWRNSAKCIGRISWNTLMVRDRRHVNEPERIFEEVHEHLRIATAGTNIQSVMTVFQAQKPAEAYGTRFWSSQIVRYASYRDEETGVTMGDPANRELTEYLLENNLWTPPELKSAFDVLPLVLKVPGIDKPFIHQLPPELVFEVNIEHPTKPEVTALGYRWCTVPAISNFKMNLGGVVYQNMPFNGWFMSTEIVRNLMERYDAGPAVAKAIGIDIETDRFWRQAAVCEVSTPGLLYTR